MNLRVTADAEFATPQRYRQPTVGKMWDVSNSPIHDFFQANTDLIVAYTERLDHECKTDAGSILTCCSITVMHVYMFLYSHC